jgi:hypothetical protein
LLGWKAPTLLPYRQLCPLLTYVRAAVSHRINETRGTAERTDVYELVSVVIFLVLLLGSLFSRDQRSRDR